MRISDWSSDVCSSDLRRTGVERIGHVGRRRAVVVRGGIAEPEGDRDPEVVAVVAAVVFVVGGIVVAPAGLVQIGRAHVRTPGTNAHLVCRLLLEKKKNSIYSDTQRYITFHNTTNQIA